MYYILLHFSKTPCNIFSVVVLIGNRIRKFSERNVVMVEIKPKIELKSKGESVNLPTVEALKVTLGWSSSVDLDLMAFYERKDGGAAGGVYSDQISGDAASLGNLNAFPFIELSGDAGVGKAAEGEETEEMKIVNLNEISKLYIVALNYTGAKAKDATASFSSYNGHVGIVDEKGNNFDVPLGAIDKGTVAHVATIDNSGAIGATLKREDTVYSFGEFVEKIPGAAVLTK